MPSHNLDFYLNISKTVERQQKEVREKGGSKKMTVVIHS